MKRRFIGLISGTSADAVDAVLLEVDDQGIRILASHSRAMPPALQAELVSLAERPGSVDLARVLDLDVGLADAFAETAMELLALAETTAAQVEAIGSHGQTLLHRPDAASPNTLQLGDPNRIAARTGMTVVADLRRADMAVGGQGAPLAPAFHAEVFADPVERRGVLNLGGIANLTLLDPARPVLGFDTGPANALLDRWCERHTGASFDRDGAWAATGQVLPELLQTLLQDEYFRRPPPKSTGRERFTLDWVVSQVSGGMAAADVQATLVAVTVESVIAAITAEFERIDRLLVCGGGVHNPVLMAALAKRLPDATVDSTAIHGIDPDYVEAATFAWLAACRLDARSGVAPSITGASKGSIGGGVYLPPAN